MTDSLDPLAQQRPEKDELNRDNDYLKLRQLLLGNDYDTALQRYISKEEDTERVAKVLAHAVELSNQKGNALGEALAPVVDEAINNSIESNPKRITNIIFPVMGPAIRKAVASALTEMVQSLNTLLEQSLSFKSVKWRLSAWRAGVPYAQYVLLQTVQFRVEQVFLVHKETGLLLHSLSAKEVSAQDPELVSSMLTAITDFVTDSFSDASEREKEASTLEKIRFGDLEILLFSGPHAILALAVRGSPSDDLSAIAHHVIETIHLAYSKELNRFDGDRNVFEKTETLLAECLVSKKLVPEKKKKPWLAIILIIAMMGFLVNHQFIQYQYQIKLDEIEAKIRSEESYVVVKYEENDNGVNVELLRSPDSNPPSTLLETLNLSSINGRKIDLTVSDTVVHFGPLPEPPELPKPLPLSKQEMYSKLVSKIESNVFYFGPKETQLDLVELEKLTKVVRDLRALQSLANELSIEGIQLSIFGFADNTGTEFGNKTVSQKRAETLSQLLIDNGVLMNSVVAWGVGNVDSDSLDEMYQRRVNLLITPRMIEVKDINGVLK